MSNSVEMNPLLTQFSYCGVLVVFEAHVSHTTLYHYYYTTNISIIITFEYEIPYKCKRYIRNNSTQTKSLLTSTLLVITTTCRLVNCTHSPLEDGELEFDNPTVTIISYKNKAIVINSYSKRRFQSNIFYFMYTFSTRCEDGEFVRTLACYYNMAVFSES